MATTRAIATTSNAIIKLLSSNYPGSVDGDLTFKLNRAEDFAQPLADGVTLFLYRMGINGALRSNTRLPLDLHYLLTAWGGSAERQQHLLGWAMRFLEDNASLPAALLNHYALPAGTVFQPGETVQIIFEALSLQDLSNLWNAAKISPPLSVGYIARIVNLDSDESATNAQLVTTREFGLAQT